MSGGGGSRCGGGGAFEESRKGDARVVLDLHTQKDTADQLHAITLLMITHNFTHCQEVVFKCS